MKIDHLGYLVKSIDSALRIFNKLGFMIDKTKNNEIIFDKDRLCNILFIKNDDTCIELIQPINELSPVYSLLKKYVNVPYHICYVSNNIDDDIEELKSSGFIVFNEKQKAVAFNNKEVIFLYNSKIGMIELLSS